MTTTDVAVTRGAAATFDAVEGVLRIQTQVAGVQLTFTPGQRTLSEQQMVLLGPLGIRADWDPRNVAVFLMECQERGLNPWNREAYLMQYAGKYVRHIGIDGFRKRGESTGRYRGRVGPFWCGDDGLWLEYWPNSGRTPVAAKVGLNRAGFDDVVWAVAMYAEFVPMQDETRWDPAQSRKVKTGRRVPGEQWRPAVEGGKPAVMIAKVAEAQAWRVAFPERFGGFYAPEEMDRLRADTPPDQDSAARRRAAHQQATAPHDAVVVVEAAGGTDAASTTTAALDDADRELLLAEMDEQAEALGRTVDDLCARWSASRGGRGIGAATLPELVDHVHRIRPYVVEALRAQNRDDEADLYARAPATATVRALFGRGPARLEPPGDEAPGDDDAEVVEP